MNTTVKDNFGQEVKIGDYVMHCEPSYNETRKLMVSKVCQVEGTSRIRTNLLRWGKSLYRMERFIKASKEQWEAYKTTEGFRKQKWFPGTID